MRGGLVSYAHQGRKESKAVCVCVHVCMFRGDVLSGVLDLEGLGHALAGGGGAAAGGLDAIDLLEATGGALDSLEAEPRDGALVLAAARCVGRRVRGLLLRAGQLAERVPRRVEVEERRAVALEEMPPRYVEVSWPDALRGGRIVIVIVVGGAEGEGVRDVTRRQHVRELELQRQPWQDVQDVRVRRRDAARVEERGHGARRLRRRRRVCAQARVVLRPSSDGHVLEHQAFRRCF